METKRTGVASSIPAGLAWGAVVNIVITVSLGAIFAKLVDAEKMAWENIGYGIAGLILLASFCGAAAAFSKIRRQRLAVCFGSGALYLGILLGTTALFFGGQYEAVGVTAALVFGGCAIAALPKSGGRRPGKGKRVRIAHR